MATTTLPPKADRKVKDRSDTKPARAMTYPLREPNGPRKQQQQRVKQGEPFDPDELSRRLQAYLVEQRIRSERRRAQRAAQAAATAPKEVKSQHLSPSSSTPGQENVYHHVPMVAASAFSRTTTPNPLRQIHALSQPAVRAHLEQVQLDETKVNAKGLKKVQAMDQAVAEREALRQRNQFQRTQSMENAAQLDGVRGVYKPQQRSFHHDSSHPAARQERRDSRPLSTEDVMEEHQPLGSTAKSKRKPKPLGVEMAERNNWTQEDEVVEAKRKDKDVSVVRKMQSSWTLLGKRSPKSEKDKDESAAGPGETVSSPEGKSTKAGFLARFKRHPN